MAAPKGTAQKPSKRTIGRDAAVKRLREFSRISIGQMPGHLGDTVMSETDRGTVILLSTAVEDMLTRRIEASMVQLSSDEHARLFGPDAPLGTFSARIKIAYALGLIDRQIVRMCDLLREMRNACAHSGRSISFHDEELRDILEILMGYITDEFVDYSISIDIPDLLKLYLIWIVGWLSRAIRTGSKEQATEEINKLVSKTIAAVKKAAEKEKHTSRKKPRERPSPKSQSSRKD